MAVIEAGCCGLPMILSDIPQHKELSVNKTIEGLEYFKLDDKQGLVEQIEKMMSNKKINCELIARHYETHFAAKEMAKKYIEQYCLLVKRE